MIRRRANQMDNNRFTPSEFDTRARHQRSSSAISVWALLCFGFILMVSCASPASTSGTRPQRTPTAPSNQSPTALPLTQQYDFTAQDSGRTVAYTITSRFEIFLNQQQYPKQNVK